MKKSSTVIMLWVMIFVFLAILAAVPVLAAEASEEAYPWSNIVVWGIAWGPAVSVVISIAKAVGLKEKFIPYLNWGLGFVGLALLQLSRGEPLGAALFAGLVAVVSAPGFYETFSKPVRATLGKS